MDDDRSAERIDLGRALTEATREFFHPDSVESTFAGVTASVTRLMESADCADILVVEGRQKFRSHAATSELPVRIDRLQEEHHEGPCLDAARRDTIVRCDDFEVDTRWPDFGRAAVQAGVRSCLSIQLYTSGKEVGALNVFAAAPNAFSSEDEELGAMLATHAAIAVYAATKNEQFESALASRDVIGQAKGMLMERYRVDAVQAFSMLAKLSQDSNISVPKLAAQIVHLGSERPQP